MVDQRQTDPTGCIHRFNKIGSGACECRRAPPALGLGGSRERPEMVWHFPPCYVRCGEYDPGAPMALVVPDLTPEQIDEFKRAFAGMRTSSVVVGSIGATYQRDPAGAYSIPAPDEDERLPTDAERRAIEAQEIANGGQLVTVEHTDWGDITHHPDGRTTFTGIVCRGSWMLGSACGRCARCVDERRKLQVGDVVRYRFRNDLGASQCQVVEIHEEFEHGVRVKDWVLIKEAYGGREATLR